jgi:hypothetical protein
MLRAVGVVAAEVLAVAGRGATSTSLQHPPSRPGCAGPPIGHATRSAHGRVSGLLGVDLEPVDAELVDVKVVLLVVVLLAVQERIAARLVGDLEELDELVALVLIDR